MVKKISRIIFAFALLVSACQTEDQLIVPVKPGSEEGRIASTTPAPQWSLGFPASVFGSSSVDFRFSTDIASTVYWVISSQPLILTASALKAQVISTTITSIKLKGISNLAAAVVKLEKPIGLLPGTKYYAYMVAEGAINFTLQTQVITRTFTTYVRQQVKEYHSVAENRTVLYLLYRPEELLKYPTKKYPILIFLGGNGELATQGNINLIRNGSIPEYLEKGNKVEMIVMSIQHIHATWNVKMIDEGLTHAIASYPVDTKKVYMTGMSGGGYGTWNYAVAYPSRLTAIVPISGGGNKSKTCLLSAVPVYAFHNKIDNTVSTSNSINMVNGINLCPPLVNAKLLLFPDTGHNCWRRVYNRNHSDWTKSPTTERVDIYAWMLSKTKII